VPTKAPRACSQPGCPNTTTDGAHCPQHTKVQRREFDRGREGSTARGYGHRWQRLRAWLLAKNPVCEECRDALSTEVHHVVPKRDGGDDSPENLMCVCRDCHARLDALIRRDT
jgi:5-methylcytosine-specific restriction enzyme A